MKPFAKTIDRYKWVIKAPRRDYPYVRSAFGGPAGLWLTPRLEEAAQYDSVLEAADDIQQLVLENQREVFTKSDSLVMYPVKIRVTSIEETVVVSTRIAEVE